MKKNPIPFAIALILFLGATLILAVPAVASPQSQVYSYTPTPLPDGRILYTIQEGDTCISISLLNNVPLDELRQLNDLDDAACQSLRIGRDLLLGRVETPAFTQAALTATPLMPSPTPFNGNGNICILLFNDIDGNAKMDANETAIAGGAISITGPNNVILNGTTDSSGDPFCFEEQPEGEYSISIAVPAGFNPTMRTNYVLALKAGDTSQVDFGAQVSQQTQPAVTQETNQSLLLAILGGIVIVAGIGLGIYALTMRK